MFRRRSSATSRRSRTQSLTPMDMLPNELLAHIFSTIMDESTENPLFVITLSHVSSRWRNVALGTGCLWARINITFPLSDIDLERTKTYLTRSGTYPLDILVDVRDPDWDWNEDAHRATWQVMVPFVRLLVAHIHQWRKFEMLSDTWVPIFTLLFYTKTVTAAPLLETLSLSRCNAYMAARGQIFHPSVLRDALPLLGGHASSTRKLRRVTLVGVHTIWTDTVLRNLTHLEFKYHSSDVMPTAEAFGAILGGCPHLTELSIVGWGPILHREVQYAEGVFQMPSLRTFTLGFVDAEYAMKLLLMFHTPALRKFVLEDVNKVISPTGVENADAFLEWLVARCGPTPTTLTIPVPLRRLRSVELHSVHAHQATFSRLFAQLPSLEQLTCIDIPNSALLALTPVCTPTHLLHARGCANSSAKGRTRRPWRSWFKQGGTIHPWSRCCVLRWNLRGIDPLRRPLLLASRVQK
ncbi:unnamed protein product [Cyclocybe aegerita]|uniref:F-box domain-containing protein n=1 Tax=Cyclocybe aegerita TaxID=1973307 RepID=A0A8S0XRS2_CYCAE|nr:unnamed protein product [Cyclocybe aegerita]